MRKWIVLTSSIELVCVMLLLIIMTVKEKMTKNVIDFIIISLAVIMLVTLVLFIFHICKKGLKK